MKGYFSTLAKQSGFRSAQSDAPGNAVGEILGNAPLHREKTILVAPDAAQTEASKTRENSASRLEKSISEKTAADTKIIAEPIKDNLSKTAAEELSTPPDSAVFQAEPLTIKSSGRKSDDENFSADESPKADDSLTIEQVVFKESADEKMFVAEVSVNSALPAGTEKSAFVESETVQPAYFKKTSELLESGTANPLEIQRILLREAQEWASDSPTAKSFEKAKGINEKRSEVRAIVAPIEKKSVDLQESFQAVAESSGKLQEQSFNLSVGSISITVEEPENKIQNQVISQNRTTETNQPEKRRYSRLSRYYL